MVVLVVILALFICQLAIAAGVMIVGLLAWELFNLPARMVKWRKVA
jgi:hypothetical protein